MNDNGREIQYVGASGQQLMSEGARGTAVGGLLGTLLGAGLGWEARNSLARGRSPLSKLTRSHGHKFLTVPGALVGGFAGASLGGLGAYKAREFDGVPLQVEKMSMDVGGLGKAIVTPSRVGRRVTSGAAQLKKLRIKGAEDAMEISMMVASKMAAQSDVAAAEEDQRYPVGKSTAIGAGIGAGLGLLSGLSRPEMMGQAIGQSAIVGGAAGFVYGRGRRSGAEQAHDKTRSGPKRGASVGLAFLPPFGPPSAVSHWMGRSTGFSNERHLMSLSKGKKGRKKHASADEISEIEARSAENTGFETVVSDVEDRSGAIEAAINVALGFESERASDVVKTAEVTGALRGATAALVRGDKAAASKIGQAGRLKPRLDRLRTKDPRRFSKLVAKNPMINTH